MVALRKYKGVIVVVSKNKLKLMHIYGTMIFLNLNFIGDK